MYKLKNFFKGHFAKSKVEDLNFHCKINENFLLINPNEIYDFIGENNSLIELINISFTLIKKYFPDSTIYLEFNQDPEYEGLNSIFANIYDGTNSYDCNMDLFEDLSLEFRELKKQYGKMDYFLDMVSVDEPFRNRLNDKFDGF